MLGSLWAKVAAGGAILLGILLAALRLIGMGRKAERRKNEAAVAKAETQALKDVDDVEKNLADLSASERRERLRRDVSDPE